MELTRRKDATFWRQLKATLIRNIIRKKRGLRHTLREFLAPLYFLLIIVIMKLVIPEAYYPQVSKPEGEASLFSADPFFYATNNTGVVQVIPDNEATRYFIDNHVKPNLALSRLHFNFLASEADLDAMFDEDPDSIYCALIFAQLGDSLNYTIRMTSESLLFRLPTTSNPYAAPTTCREKGGREEGSSSLMADFGNGLFGNLKAFAGSYLADTRKDPPENHTEFRFPINPNCPVTSYYWSGFSTLQAVVEHEWIRMKNDTHQIPDVTLQILPKPEVTGDSATVLRSIIPLYLVISLSQFITPMLMVVVDEKEKKIKESMKMVGLRDSVFWLSWFLVYSVMVVLISILGCILVFFVVMPNSNFGVLFVLMLEFGLSMIMFAFMLTAMFSKAKAAGIFGGMATLLLSCLYYLEVFLADSPEIVFWFLGLLSPTAMAMGIDKMILFDIEDRPLDLWESAGTIPIAGVMIMLAVDIVLYGLLAVWLDNIVPTEYGTRRKPWFCFQPSYWFQNVRIWRKRLYHAPSDAAALRNSRHAGSDDSKFSGEDVEEIPASMLGKEAIVIDDIKKSFKSFGKPAVHAVKGISLKIYPGEITAILGHNGAGKTTLFNMLTGMTSVTSGKADIFGYDVTDSNEMEEIRKMTGICPQHDVLFDELTAREHLQFFARIRGMEENEIGEEVDSILKDIDLTEKADAVAKNLSGGQKRKLSVGIALIGDPKIIFLDEPTAGVDPFSRRHMWSILKQRKEGKVILLTTHFMDEADILADRKAIVSNGAVRCYGSSLFLKNKFGVGYHLTLVLESNGDLPGIRNLIHSYIPTAEQARLFGRELSFILPRNDDDKFPDLFSAIEKQISERGPLGISSYGVSMTTLEEIFLHLGEEEEAKKEEQELINLQGKKRWSLVSSHESEPVQNGKDLTVPANKARMSNNQEDKGMEGFAFEAIQTKKSSWQAYKALLYVRTVRKYRELWAVVVQIILPLVYVSLGIFLTDLQAGSVVEDNPLKISSSIYEVPRNNEKPRFDEVFSYVNRTDRSIDSFIDSIANISSQLPGDTTFSDLLGTKHVSNLDFLNFTSTGTLSLLALVNHTAQHSIPLVVNTLSNMYTKMYGMQEITVSTQPFVYTSVSDGTIFVGFTYVILPIGLAMELIEDREIRAKNQLRVNGLGFGIYYASFFTILGAMMLFECGALLALIQIFQLTPLMLTPAFITLLILYLMFTVPAIFFASVVSYMFDKIENGQFLFPIASYMGFLPYIAISVLDMLQVADGNAGKICHVVFSFLSPLYLPFGIVYFINRYYITSLCTVFDNCDELTLSDYWGQYEIWTQAVACVFHAIIWFVALRVIDVVKDGGSVKDGLKSVLFWRADKESYSRLPEVTENPDDIAEEDEDVKKEREEVSRYMLTQQDPMDAEKRVVAVRGLRKTFKTNEAKKAKAKSCKKKSGDVEEEQNDEKVKVAVRNLTLGVGEGETFGLLGHNGAGKTTTMRIITAEEAPTCGSVRIGEHNITSNASPGFELLGYCPQFDAVWRTITIKEHLEVYAAIRGVPPKEISRIQEHSHKYAKDCSGGTKRKLSYAMSMLGDPKIVLLDEPSTGMDPQSKRFVWDTIMASFKKDRGAILTTHSMEEADALCTRVGIMVKGELRCLGSTQHLKNKYGGGYMLDVKLRNATHADSFNDRSWQDLQANIEESFKGAELSESFADRRTYAIPQASVASLAVAFQLLERLKSTYDVEEYSFGQTTLEQVFIEFAKQQEEADRLEAMGEKTTGLRRLNSDGSGGPSFRRLNSHGSAGPS